MATSFQEANSSSNGISRQLNETRQELLDLGLRNTLINYRTLKSRGVDIVDELPPEVYRTLVVDGRNMSFKALPDTEGTGEANALAQPEDNPTGELATRHTDHMLQTNVTSGELQKRLLNSYYQARLSLEEQGVSVLYLALGMIEWYEEENSNTARHAPLLLVPVELERSSARDRFHVMYTGEDIGENLSLTEKFANEFGVIAPPFPDPDELNTVSYFDAWADAIIEQPRWKVRREEIALGFFSFGKFLMYRDLDSEIWPEDHHPEQHAIVYALLGEGFPSATPSFADDVSIDNVVKLDRIHQVVDADSSQTLAILEANAGRNLVIQGPPGTGKSQTITNIIAEAIAAGKTVLFVSEKMAALEVVKRRLDQVGIGDACLELHSHKTNKRALLTELQRTLVLDQPRVLQDADDLRLTEDAIQRLNVYSDAVNDPLGSTGLTPYQVFGWLMSLQSEYPGKSWPSLDLPKLATWTQGEFRMHESMIEDLEARLQTLGSPIEHPFWGVEKEILLPSEHQRFVSLVAHLHEQLSGLLASASALAGRMDLDRPSTIEDVKSICTAAHRIASIPAIPGPNYAAEEWGTAPDQIREILHAGMRLDELHSVHGDIVYEPEWRDPQIQAGLEDLSKALTTLLEQSAKLLSALHLSPDHAVSLWGIRQLIEGARLIADGPETRGVTVSAQEWLLRTGEIRTLLDQGIQLRSLQAELQVFTTDDAWGKDFTSLRDAFTAHQGKWWRFLSSDFRDARKTLAGYCRGTLPGSIDDQIVLLETLIKAKCLSDEITKQADLGQKLFGPHWRARFSDWDQLQIWAEWILLLYQEKELRRIPSGLPQFLDAGYGREDLSQLADAVESALAEYALLVPNLRSVLNHDQQSQLRLGDARSGLFGQQQTVDVLGASYQCVSSISQLADCGHKAFGGFWHDGQSYWNRLEPFVEWTISIHEDVRDGLLPGTLPRVLTGITDGTSYSDQANRVSEQLALYCRDLDEMVQLIEFNSTRRSWESLKLVPLAEHEKLLATWNTQTSGILDIASFNAAVARCVADGLERVVDLAIRWPEAQEQMSAAFRYARAQALADRATRERITLAMFDRPTHERVQDRFRHLDVLLLERTRTKVAHLHWKRLPRHQGGGQLATLRREFQKKARHLPIRKLVERCGNAIQVIKPVFMMSPMSVATYLPPGSITFDLVIFDEASQVRSADALGALLRGKQAVVVGDSKQLPPTRFFDTLTHGEDIDEDEPATRDIESILGLFTAKNALERMLRWHYRSQHESLIAVSNYEFYDNRLLVFPSPDAGREHFGLILHHLSDTAYDRGSSRTNQEEARIVAEAVIAHARQQPGLTLGVAAFSKAQAELILLLVDQLRRSDPMVEPFFALHPHEPFFVKNLENVQGDERDVIFISVGYGRDANGYLQMNFGPLNNDGGERRLNVLITRARKRCEVFTNLTADDIDLNRTLARGVLALKRFLKYAETGQLDIPEATGRDMDSPFEEAVYSTLTKAGYQLQPQVGSAGFFIDLAVVDPDRPGRYLLGIECDGATYHSARSARDRDRLRQEVLEGLGWTIHRIWSTDWFRNPDREIRRAVEAIEAARASAAARLSQVSTRNPRTSPIKAQSKATETFERIRSTAIPASEIGERRNFNETAGSAVAYRVAQLSLDTRGLELHEMPPRQLAQAIVEVVRIESPVHIEEISRRIADAVGVKRRGSRIEARIRQAIRVAEREHSIKRHGDFLWLPTMRKPPIRDRSGQAGFLRSIEAIAPEELTAAVLRVVTDSYGINRVDIPQSTGGLLGFQRISANIRSSLELIIDNLLAQNMLVAQGDFLTVAP